MTLVMFVNGTWHPLSGLLLATNRYVLTMASIGLTYMLVGFLGLIGSALSLPLLDVIRRSSSLGWRFALAALSNSWVPRRWRTDGGNT